MKVVFYGETKDNKPIQDILYLRDGISKGVIRDVFKAWIQQNECNYGVRFIKTNCMSV